MKCEPASTIIRLLGGLTVVAAAGKTTITTVQRWRMPSERGGTGGNIPFKYHDRLIEFATIKGIEFPRGAFVDPEIAKLLIAPEEVASPAPSEAA